MRTILCRSPLLHISPVRQCKVRTYQDKGALATVSGADCVRVQRRTNVRHYIATTIDCAAYSSMHNCARGNCVTISVLYGLARAVLVASAVPGTAAKMLPRHRNAGGGTPYTSLSLTRPSFCKPSLVQAAKAAPEAKRRIATLTHVEHFFSNNISYLAEAPQ